jgi:hypothetical protein
VRPTGEVTIVRSLTAILAALALLGARGADLVVWWDKGLFGQR